MAALASNHCLAVLETVEDRESGKFMDYKRLVLLLSLPGSGLLPLAVECDSRALVVRGETFPTIAYRDYSCFDLGRVESN